MPHYFKNSSKTIELGLRCRGLGFARIKQRLSTPKKKRCLRLLNKQKVLVQQPM
jgi:hypothetical protein